jgi:hypothetical protein
MSNKPSSPVLSCHLKKGTPPPKKKVISNHFINFKIINQDGNPEKDICIHIVYPDGRTSEEIHSDDKGMIELKNIPNGNYQIEFEWRGVKMSEAVLLQS